MNLRLLISVCVCLCLSAATPRTYLWKGFDHAWQRTFLGFAVPHRLGNFANYIIPRDDDTATANITFTPGVDGDKAQPILYATGLRNVWFDDRQSTELVWNDSAPITDNPSASKHFYVDVDLSVPQTAGWTYGAVLNGFRIDMLCDPDRQPSGKDCNSNSTWPTRLWVQIENCTQPVAGGPLKCKLQLDFDRAWTPGENPLGKAFNYRMNFRAFVYYNIIGGLASSWKMTDFPANTISSTTHNEPIPIPVTVVGSPSYAFGTSGLVGFGFQMKETGGKLDLGRYMSRLTFSVQSEQYNSNNYKLSYMWRAGFKAPPATTAISDIDYNLKVALLQFNSATIDRDLSATGQICRPGPGFTPGCTGLPIRDNDAVVFP